MAEKLLNDTASQPAEEEEKVDKAVEDKEVERLSKILIRKLRRNMRKNSSRSKSLQRSCTCLKNEE